MLLFFTFWLNLGVDPCLRTTADPTLLSWAFERDGLAVTYDGRLEAFRSDRLETWFFYRTDSPFQVPESGTLGTVLVKIRGGDDTETLAFSPHPSCALPPSRPRG